MTDRTPAPRPTTSPSRRRSPTRRRPTTPRVSPSNRCRRRSMALRRFLHHQRRGRLRSSSSLLIAAGRDLRPDHRAVRRERTPSHERPTGRVDSQPRRRASEGLVRHRRPRPRPLLAGSSTAAGVAVHRHRRRRSRQLVGTIVGAFAGFRGGRIDDILMRVTDLFLAFPLLVPLLVLRNAVRRGRRG